MPTGIFANERHTDITNHVLAMGVAGGLPLMLIFLFVLAVDFGRVFYAVFIVENAARCGAIYGSGNSTRAQDTSGIKLKALAEAKDLDPLLVAVTSKTGVDSIGNPCIDVTVIYSFQMVTSYLTATTFNVTCRVRMRVGQMVATFN